MRLPTKKQYRKLAVLAVPGTTALAPSRGDWNPLLRRGWVQCISEDENKRFLPPLQITPAGLRAVADYLERNPLGEWPPEDKPRQLDEAPSVTRLKDQLAEAQAQRDDAQRDLYRAQARLRQIARALGDDVGAA